jgi:predicted ATP-grasp superfamily ATP-dependent carboligase
MAKNDTSLTDSLRILLPEGSSTSAREAVTALGLKGHQIEICDPDPHCIARFSRFVGQFHRCPGLRRDPAGFLAFVLDLLDRRRFDVLLPTHEQGLLLAKAQRQLTSRIAVALPSFESYRTALSKTAFSRLLVDLDVPQPATSFVTSASELSDAVRYPCVAKTAIGTASRGVWLLLEPADLGPVLQELAARNAFASEVLLQDFVAGIVEHAQAVFCRGQLCAIHAYRQLARGAGGGAALKESVLQPVVGTHLARIGMRLAWHGALSVDYILREPDGTPLLIDCNPRLVEPMNAYFSGLDLVDLLVQVSRGETPGRWPEGRAGVRTHLAMQALLGCGMRKGSRRELVAEFLRLVRRRAIYADSREELTPVKLDWPSALPLGATLMLLLANPHLAYDLPKRGWGSHLLDDASVRLIEQTEL